MKARLIKSNPPNHAGAYQKLYSLDTPLEGNSHVVVSTVMAIFSGPETYIFPSDAEGNITDYGELFGSQKGHMDHKRSLESAGYEVIE